MDCCVRCFDTVCPWDLVTDNYQLFCTTKLVVAACDFIPTRCKVYSVQSVTNIVVNVENIITCRVYLFLDKTLDGIFIHVFENKIHGEVFPMLQVTCEYFKCDQSKFFSFCLC